MFCYLTLQLNTNKSRIVSSFLKRLTVMCGIVQLNKEDEFYPSLILCSCCSCSSPGAASLELCCFYATFPRRKTFGICDRKGGKEKSKFVKNPLVTSDRLYKMKEKVKTAA